MNLRPYQIEPVARLSKSRRALLEARAASGKTVIMAAAINAVLNRGEPRFDKSVRIGWIANTIEQCKQANEAIALFPEIARVCTVKVRCAAACEDWCWCDLLIVDECHHAVAPEWCKQIRTCNGARWGMTATPNFEGEDAEQKTAILRDLFSDNVIRVDADEVAKTLAKARVVLLDPQWEPGLAERIDAETERLYKARIKRWGGDPQKLRAMVWWQKCVEIGIIENDVRTEAGVSFAVDHIKRGESVMVLVNQVEHAEKVAAWIGRGAVACYSGMGAKARRHAIYDFKHGKIPCIVATSLADEGLDVPRASVLVLISGGRSKTKAEQRTGRVLRAFAGKEHGLIYDFADSQHRLMAKHAASRQEVYRRLNYEFVEDLSCLPGLEGV